MKNASYLNRWVQFNERNQSIIAPILLTLLAVAFLVSDFIVNYFSVADFLFMLISAVLLITGQYRISSRQIIWTSIPILILLLNIILATQHTDLRLNSSLITQSIKGLFYLFAILGFYNYIVRNQLKKTFLSVNIIMAFIAIVIGIYITVALYSNGTLPYEGLWTLTRSHPTSYEYQGNPSIIRTRSLFSEPAHLGYYLNIVLSAYLFSRLKYERKMWVYGVLIIGLFSTLSYSMIAIMLIILAMYFAPILFERSLEWRNWFAVPIFLTVGLGIYFWEFIYITLIQRTVNILTGQDASAFNRLFESWQYVNQENIWFGNGIGQTPVITNNYAYILSDFGLLGFIPIVLLTLWLLKKNATFTIVLILLNFFRGGYLGPTFWILGMFLYTYGFDHNERDLRGSIFNTN